MHVVSKSWIFNQPDDSTTNVVDDTMDFALILSDNLGRNIRQGNNFRVVGMQASLTGGNGDLDLGGAVHVSADYLPTTHHSRKAWNQVFQAWKKQKQLKSGVGSSVRYDDMEFAWSDGFIIPGRTSTVYGQGLGDTSTESLCLQGSSTSGTDFVLSDYYNSRFITPNPSTDHFDSSVIKQPKYGTTPFPNVETLHMAATYSANAWSSGAVVETDGYMGGIAMNDWQYLPSDNHIGFICGVTRIKAQLIPPDTAWQNADQLTLTVSFAIEGWNPLVYKPKRSWMPKRTYKRTYAKRSYGGRKYGKRRYKRRY